MQKVITKIGDNRKILKSLAVNSIDSIVTDPPYGLSFMGKKWDYKVPRVDVWQECLRVLKPGGYLIAFAGTRTYHRAVCVIEDAGFEIRDQLQWLYGSGFPKSHNLGDGWGTALKPANEPIALARKPLSEKTVAANVLRWGTGAINVDGCRVEAHDERSGGFGQGNRPWRTGNIGGNTIKVGTELGRWPANVLHDGSAEVLEMFPASSVTGKRTACSKAAQVEGTNWLSDNYESTEYTDSGSAARFFYCAKASKKDRAGSKHPTVKPVKLMQWLVRLITPPGGTVLDPFAGTGTTAEAALLEGMQCILIEREVKYGIDIKRRMSLAGTLMHLGAKYGNQTSSALRSA